MTVKTLTVEAAVEFTDWKHERVLVSRGSRSGIPIIVAVHSTKLGPALGGCRMCGPTPRGGKVHWMCCACPRP